MDCRVKPGNDGLEVGACPRSQVTNNRTREEVMTNGRVELTRRQWLAGSLLAVGLPARGAWALETIRQGFQTNIWGMPTYYLLKSRLLEKHGLKFEGIAGPSRKPPHPPMA